MNFVGVSTSSFLSMSPAMIGAYVLVGGVGVVCILSGVLERKLFGGSFSFVYDWINIGLKIGMPLAFVALLLRFIFSL
ncbi:hypothetical protein [Metabacillus bambusae]|uniref:Uncharacterized protein n=1 Tax=Metabacillus bambusae TaxID=2795218 RepID=A0ABS3NCF9_9BACI|nr:hypothetical protein [Metabacillus bambusae]MBO1515664.1 hypothetical protein [Metabacillus bambusae]